MLAILPVYVLAVSVEVGFGWPMFILKFIKAPQLRLETQQTLRFTKAKAALAGP